MTSKTLKYYLFCIILWANVSCYKAKQERNGVYNGPLLEIDNIEMVYGDSAQVTMRMQTAKELDLVNQDKVFPKEVRLFFTEKNSGQETTTIRADSGRYDKTKNIFKLMGNVLIKDKVKNQQLTSPDLNWSPDKKIFYTHNQVELTTPTQRIKGQGLEANQEFTQYSLGTSSGVIDAQ